MLKDIGLVKRLYCKYETSRWRSEGANDRAGAQEGVGLIKQRNVLQLASILPALDEILHVDAIAELFGRPETHRERAEFERRRREVKRDEKLLKLLEKLLDGVWTTILSWYAYRGASRLV
jgi:hypothetical protein